MVFQRARAFPGLSKGAHRYSHLAVAAMEREERDLPKSLQNYMKFVVELHKKSGSKKLLKLKGPDPYKDGTEDRNGAPAVKKRRLENSFSEIGVY